MNYIYLDTKPEEWHQYLKDFEMRAIDKAECLAVGASGTLEGLIRGLSLSIDHYAGIGIDSETKELIWACGVASTEDPLIGAPWLLASDKFKPNIDWLKTCKKSVIGKMNKTFPLLRNYIHKDNLETIKWLEWLGFTVYPQLNLTFKKEEVGPMKLFAKLGDNHV